MIGITIVFILIACHELRYLSHHKRKPRTYWITCSFLIVAYAYNMAVYSIDDLPGMSQLIEYLFKF